MMYACVTGAACRSGGKAGCSQGWLFDPHLLLTTRRSVLGATQRCSPAFLIVSPKPAKWGG